MEPTQEEMQELADWIASRPPKLREVMDHFPPACYVIAKRQGLLCPAPGVTAILEKYEENLETGRITLTVTDGVWSADCDPDWLEVVDSEEQFRLYRAACEMIPT